MTSVRVTLNLDSNPGISTAFISPETPSFPVIDFGLEDHWNHSLPLTHAAPSHAFPGLQPCWGTWGQGASALVDLDLCVIRLDGLLILRLPGPQALEGEGGIVEFELILQGARGCGKVRLFFLVL